MVFLEVYVDKFVAMIVRSLDLYPAYVSHVVLPLYLFPPHCADIICSHSSLRHVCRALVEALGTRFESARHVVLAGFFFLRFICPSIIAPEGYDLLESGGAPH